VAIPGSPLPYSGRPLPPKVGLSVCSWTRLHVGKQQQQEQHSTLSPRSVPAALGAPGSSTTYSHDHSLTRPRPHPVLGLRSNDLRPQTISGHNSSTSQLITARTSHVGGSGQRLAPPPTWPMLHWCRCQRGPACRLSATDASPHHPSHVPTAPAAPLDLHTMESIQL
jgi:hypothetical protein